MTKHPSPLVGQALKNIFLQPCLKRKAFNFCNSNRLFEAEKIAQNIIANNPYTAWAYYILGKVQWQKHEQKITLENLQIAINLEPQTIYFKKFRDARIKEKNTEKS